MLKYFYYLVYDDDDFSLYNYNMPLDMPEDMLTQSPMPEDMLIKSPMPENVLMQPPMTDNVMYSVLKFLSVNIPDAIYDPNWREEQKKKAIHPEFYTMWNNLNYIFTDEKEG